MPPGDYRYIYVGTAPGGAPLTRDEPTTVSSPAVPNEELEDSGSWGTMTFDTPSTTMGTMTVRVRPCSRIYHRAEPTMASYGYLLDPGYTFDVYATQGWWTATANADIHASLAPAITGGTWPTYTCDGGSSNTWFRLTDGSGYVFTGGVDIVAGSFVPGTTTYPGLSGWTGNGSYSSSVSADGNPGVLTVNHANSYGYSPRQPATAGNSYMARVWIRSIQGGSIDLCFYDSAGATTRCVTGPNLPQHSQWAIYETSAVTAAAGEVEWNVRTRYGKVIDNLTGYENGVPGPIDEPAWAIIPSPDHNFGALTFSGGAMGWPGGWQASAGEDGGGAMDNPHASTTYYSPRYTATPGNTYQARLWARSTNSSPYFQICMYTALYQMTRCSNTNVAEHYQQWGVYSSPVLTAATNEVYWGLAFRHGFMYDNVVGLENGVPGPTPEPAFANAPVAANAVNLDFNGNGAGWIGNTYNATGGVGGTGGMNARHHSSGGYTVGRWTATPGDTYQVVFDAIPGSGGSSSRFNICFYDANSVLTRCVSQTPSLAGWNTYTGAVLTAAANERSYRFTTAYGFVFDNLRVYHNGSLP